MNEYSPLLQFADGAMSAVQIAIAFIGAGALAGVVVWAVVKGVDRAIWAIKCASYTRAWKRGDYDDD